ncbi:hypothetical protein GCM10023193_73050 [Planotetraspora kaengkrachanensis]|uniref:Uncharacterized protein n=1 Tax=Planotetraspora kaengkrachanensis TaxID=575193 RepID=A0A8J3PZI1_9ACTN|nr:hypothetical protein Pka01_70990 [Planotetraspora kaengkrachanensis]
MITESSSPSIPASRPTPPREGLITHNLVSAPTAPRHPMFVNMHNLVIMHNLVSLPADPRHPRA